MNEVHQRCCCGICWHVADEPLSCGSKDGCTGVFCTKCLSNELTLRQKCPLCQLPISGPPQKNNIIKEMIFDELVYCSFAQLPLRTNPSKKAKTQLKARSACQWTGAFKDFEAHIAHNCEFAPVTCTNQGCTFTPLRSQLANHLTNECLFRTTPCPHCTSSIKVGQQAVHLKSCGKVSLTCADCRAPFLREDLDTHADVCPEKLLACPFECHGCSDDVLRKDFAQHQIDSAVAHAELLADELRDVKEQLADLIATKMKEETVNATWIIPNAFHRLVTNGSLSSRHLNIKHISGLELYLHADLRPDGLSLFVCKRAITSTYKAAIRIGGTIVTLLHPTDNTRDIKRMFSDTSLLEGPHGSLGWAAIVIDIKPYIATNGSITITCKVRCQVDTEPDAIMI